jgi:hypothetical protein
MPQKNGPAKPIWNVGIAGDAASFQSIPAHAQHPDKGKKGFLAIGSYSSRLIAKAWLTY